MMGLSVWPGWRTYKQLLLVVSRLRAYIAPRRPNRLFDETLTRREARRRGRL